MGRALRTAFVVMVVVAAILGIVALALNSNVVNSTQRSNRVQCVIAFNIIAVIVLLIAVIIYLVLIFADVYYTTVLLILSFVLVAVGLLSYIIACACGSIGTRFEEWLLSALWSSLAATILGIVLAIFGADD
ncbi:hypothetical protein EG68_02678 [Paragonimus skrjabini miyazakii]|uniref:MARVEL domain-containing protein n=1 Tax=Paragonimus skrjabini miyazakii TaxID=59628 RepID=A0A8S9ZA46_9TREM|nr:hypothetical protein EG68_02678 [Paragonimus skrjabini miyazakii]